MRSRPLQCKIGILRIGAVNAADIVGGIKDGLNRAFPNASCILISESLPILNHAFDETRQQYNSHLILKSIQRYADSRRDFECVLGIVDIDLFVAGLNFVFGEAAVSGRAALISLWRLKPEFYGDPPNQTLFLQRAVKEAVHEVGHTLGLEHCRNRLCIMYFSNSIGDTDRKQAMFCNLCQAKIDSRLNQL